MMLGVIAALVVHQDLKGEDEMAHSECPLTDKWMERALVAEQQNVILETRREMLKAHITDLLNEIKELHLRIDRLESEITANPVRIWKQPDPTNAYSGRVDIEARLIKPKDKVE